MFRKMIGLLVLFIAGLGLYHMNGCSLIGLTIGAVSDASKPDSLTIPGWEIHIVKPGTKVNVLFKDGVQHSGEFAGIERLPPEKYAEKYTYFQENITEFFLPKLGDTITVALKSGIHLRVDFVGFDYNYEYRKPKREMKSNFTDIMCIVSANQFPDSTSDRIPVSNIDEMYDSEGNSVEGRVLERLANEEQIPLLSTIAIEDSTGRSQFGIDEVHQIGAKVKKSGALTGFLVGAALDVMLILAVSSGSNSGSDVEYTGQGMCGCPFVYSYDGQRYVLDSETFGGSIFRAAQRTDLDRLDYLRWVDGTCRLRITDELQETDYVDEIRLLFVDHPKETVILPSFDGTLYSVSDPLVPMRAFDYHGNNVITLIRSKDDRLWISNPLGKYPNIRRKTRDELYVDFPKPENAAFVKLIITSQNTLWAAFLQSHFLELYGENLQAFYELLNTSIEARNKLQQAMVREGMLLIDVWNGEDWRSAGYIWEVGTATSRDQVVLLDLQNIPGDILKIRLHSTAGLWMVDQIEADYSNEVHFEVEEIAPLNVTDHMGTNCRACLMTTDGIYHKMVTGDWVELDFQVPPCTGTLDRTYILKSSGYYQIDVDAKGTSRIELITRFLNEPGAFGEYTIELLNRWIVSAIADLQ